MNSIAIRERDKYWDSFFELVGSGRPFILPAPNQLLRKNEIFKLLMREIKGGSVTVNADGKIRQSAKLGDNEIAVEQYERFLRDAVENNSCEEITFTSDYCLKNGCSVTQAVRLFFEPFYSNRGLTFPGVNAVVIGGCYKSTWIGLHNDHCDTFLYSALGRKKMYIWPPSYFEPASQPLVQGLNGDCLGHVDVSGELKDAHCFDVKAGELLYIPAGWWHYNLLSSPQPTLTLSLGLFSESQNQRAFAFPQAGIVDIEELMMKTAGDVGLALKILKLASSGGVISSGVDKERLIHSEWIRLKAGTELYLISLSEQRNECLLFANNEFLPIETDESLKEFIMDLSRRQIKTCGSLTGKQTEVLIWLTSVGAIDGLESAF